MEPFGRAPDEGRRAERPFGRRIPFRQVHISLIKPPSSRQSMAGTQSVNATTVSSVLCDAENVYVLLIRTLHAGGHDTSRAKPPHTNAHKRVTFLCSSGGPFCGTWLAHVSNSEDDRIHGGQAQATQRDTEPKPPPASRSAETRSRYEPVGHKRLSQPTSVEKIRTRSCTDTRRIRHNLDENGVNNEFVTTRRGIKSTTASERNWKTGRNFCGHRHN